MPYISKTIGINLIKLAAHVIMGGKIPKKLLKHSIPPYASIKVPQFSFMRLEGADPTLSVEMMSTGEVACIGEDFPDALVKSLMAADFYVPLKLGNILITVSGPLQKKVAPLAKRLERLGAKVFATEHTADVLKETSVDVNVLHKVSEKEKKPNIMDYILERDLDLVINIPLSNKSSQVYEDEYLIRRKAVEFNIPVVTNLQLAQELVYALEQLRDKGITNIDNYHEKIDIKDLNEYHKLNEFHRYW